MQVKKARMSTPMYWTALRCRSANFCASAPLDMATNSSIATESSRGLWKAGSSSSDMAATLS